MAAATNISRVEMETWNIKFEDIRRKIPSTTTELVINGYITHERRAQLGEDRNRKVWEDWRNFDLSFVRESPILRSITLVNIPYPEKFGIPLTLDLEPLSSCKQLEYLEIRGNRGAETSVGLIDFSPLVKCPKLETIVIRRSVSRYLDLSPL